MIQLLKGLVIALAGTSLILLGASMVANDVIEDLVTSDMLFILPSHSFFPPTHLMSESK